MYFRDLKNRGPMKRGGDGMEYRTLKKGGEQISALGLGCGSIDQADEKEMEETLHYAVEHGINYFDAAASSQKPYPAYGRALKDVRRHIYLQVHFGADYSSGEYGWTTDLDRIKKSVDWQMKNLQTDYIDFGFLHCLDEEEDLRQLTEGGVLDYMLDLKAQGVIRHLALSTHEPALANRVLDLGLVDLIMFSVNPAYDYGQGEYALGSGDERTALYRRCEREGVGISVMKPFAGGRLLSAARSPFGREMTRYQCLKYALDKPGVLTVLPGIRGMDDLKDLLGFFDADPSERDYSQIAAFTPTQSLHQCVYCSHCMPCPAGLNIALINKYYDLARTGDALAEEHYRNLAKKAGDCVGCGHCSKRCPFGVDAAGRMQEIRAWFSE